MKENGANTVLEADAVNAINSHSEVSTTKDNNEPVWKMDVPFSLVSPDHIIMRYGSDEKFYNLRGN